MHQLISAALVTDADAQLISAPEHPGSSPASWGGETLPWNVGILIGLGLQYRLLPHMIAARFDIGVAVVPVLPFVEMDVR